MPCRRSRDEADEAESASELRWRKVKGRALVELADGTVAMAELHWYDAHGIGRRDMKVKRLLE